MFLSLTPRCFTHPARFTLVRILVALAAMAGLVALPSSASAMTLQPGFEEGVAFDGLEQPIALQFSQDGRVFVGEKSGLIKVFDGMGDTTPTVFADLRTQVHNYWDRGLMSIALHPNFPATPYVYVYYVRDALIGGTAPRWGVPGATSDTCPNPPGGTVDGCVVSGRLSRLTAVGNTMTSEHPLIDDWCQQYPSHAGGGIGFGADGYLYFSGGDGAAWHFADYGQDGDPVNPCGDPPGGAGVMQTAPTAQGGRLRAQDLRTPGDPVGLNGSLIRIDPITGDAAPGNPLAGHADPNARRIISYGLRNPFRMAMRPGTSDAYMADVGGGYWEEINRVNGGTDPVKNFGWPCYEGGTHADGSVYAKKLASWDAMNLDICENLYADGTSAAPYWAYEHDVPLTPVDNCDPGGNSISGIEFYPQAGGDFPTSFGSAMFFADYSRECIWVMKKGANGLPDPTKLEMFANLGIYPVDLKVGPGGDLFFVDIGYGMVRRISYTGDDNRTPTARAEASPAYGPAPLEVGFDASGSTDPDGDELTYAWDLDGDGEYDDADEEFPRRTYAEGSHEVSLRVTDPSGASHTDTIRVESGETPPTVSIDSPSAALHWHVGQAINFAGSATDEQDGTLGPAALSWKLILNHCVTVDACHSHPVQDFAGVASGEIFAPDHGYPSHMVLEVTATDSRGLKDTDVSAARPADGQPHGRVRARRAGREHRRGLGSGAARARDHRRLHHDHLRGVAAGRGPDVLRVRGVVGRKGAEPRDHGTVNRHHVHRELRGADEADVPAGRGCPCRSGDPEHELRRVEQAPCRRRRRPEHRELPPLQRDRCHRSGGEREAETLVDDRHDRRPDRALDRQQLVRGDDQLVEPPGRRHDGRGRSWPDRREHVR